MRRSQPAWGIASVLILSQVCSVSEGLPFSPQRDSLHVQKNRDTAVIEGRQVEDLGGFYNTRLEQDGHPTLQPFPTDISYLVFHDRPEATHHPSVPHLDYPSESGVQKSGLTDCQYRPGQPCSGTPHVELSGNATATTVRPQRTQDSPSAMADQDIFLPIATDPVPSNIPSRDDHPISKEHVNADGPISTNKFYSNFFVGSQTNGTFTHPYSVGWAKGGQANSHGLAISHVEPSQRAFGEPQDSIPGSPVKYYVNPVGIQSMILSAVELGDSTTLTVSNPTAFSADAVLQPKSGSNTSITFPVTQGMGFITGIYNNLQPALQSSVMFRDVAPASNPRDGVFKYRVTLESDEAWLIYVVPDDGTDPKLDFNSTEVIRGPPGFIGTIHVAKNPGGEAGEAVYDGSSGAYAKSVQISGSVNGAQGTYSLQWEKAGKGVDTVPLLMFALPHHVESFDDETGGRSTDVQLATTTKGNATAYTGETWTMVEPNLPVNIDFAPVKPGATTQTDLSEAAKQLIATVAPDELSQSTDDQTNLDSMYYSGKGLNKFAGAIYTIMELVQDDALASATFESLKGSFDRFVQNKQKWPLAYDNVWKGVASTGSYETGDPGLDFGNTLYNDHHFHYGYFILAAAYIGRLDPNWLDANKAWVNTLLRDAGNSVADDLFPFSRAFDWYHGHSWAKGLFESLDGKDEESTSEDSMFAYAVKMWGKTIGDASMEARGNMMLAILARSLNNYFLMKSDNVNQPANFIDNKVTGILFENKADHATYFGTNLEYIQGIHMLPLLPNSVYTRSPDFVQEEWDAMFAPGAAVPAENVEGGWQGVLFANLAEIDAAKSWDFFAQDNFDLGNLDGGASRIWYLAYAAGLGGGPQ